MSKQETEPAPVVVAVKNAPAAVLKRSCLPEYAAQPDSLCTAAGQHALKALLAASHHTAAPTHATHTRVRHTVSHAVVVHLLQEPVHHSSYAPYMRQKEGRSSDKKKRADPTSAGPQDRRFAGSQPLSQQLCTGCIHNKPQHTLPEPNIIWIHTQTDTHTQIHGCTSRPAQRHPQAVVSACMAGLHNCHALLTTKAGVIAAAAR